MYDLFSLKIEQVKFKETFPSLSQYNCQRKFNIHKLYKVII